MNRIPTQARGRRRQFFEADGVDELLGAVLELTAEVSTLRERLFVTERVLERQGLSVGDAIERYEFDAGDREALARERRRLLQTVLRSFEAPRRDDGDTRQQPGAAETSEAA
ncbi:MAG: hypothetical protein AAFX58_14215 [Pseudomonadota bacterium]